MFEKAIFLVLASLFGLFFKLSLMPEVRRVREIVGGKDVYLKISPQQINPFYIHDKNHAICNDFFYRRVLIKYSYTLCLLFTVASIGIGIPSFLSNSKAATNTPLSQIKTTPVNKTEDLDVTTINENTILTIHGDGTYSMIDISQGTEIIIFNTDGNVLRILEGNNILFALIYFGILVGIMCLVLAGPLKKIEQ